MHLSPLPSDYANLLDPGDRIRKAEQKTTGRRVVRRIPSRTTKG